MLVESLDHASGAFLSTAAISGRCGWLLAELWSRWDDLDDATRERLCTVELCTLAASEAHALLELEAMLGFEGYRRVVAGVGENLVKTWRTIPISRVDRAAVVILEAALAVGDHDTAVSVLVIRPELVTRAHFATRAGAAELLARMLVRCESELGEITGTWGGFVLSGLSQIATSEGSAEERGAALGLLGVVADWEPVAALIRADPAWISESVVDAWDDPIARMTKLLGELNTSEGARWLSSKLLDHNEDRVSRLVLTCLPWDMDVVRLLVAVDPDDRVKVKNRMARLAAQELEGDAVSQEIFWSLSENWPGTVGELIAAAKQLGHSVNSSGWTGEPVATWASECTDRVLEGSVP